MDLTLRVPDPYNGVMAAETSKGAAMQTTTTITSDDLRTGDIFKMADSGEITYTVIDIKHDDATMTVEIIAALHVKGDEIGQCARVHAQFDEVELLNPKTSPSSVTGPDFWASSIFHMTPRAHLMYWLAGDEVECPAGCGETVEEGGDCSHKHFDALGEKVQALLEESLKEVN